MNRFEYVQAKLLDDEVYVAEDVNVKLYDGEDKTKFEDGHLMLTTHRLFWGRPRELMNGCVTLCLQLKYVASIKEEIVSSYIFGRKVRLILHLGQPASDKLPGPLDNSSAAFIKLSAKKGLSAEFSRALTETLVARVWQVADESGRAAASGSGAVVSANNTRIRTGIGGIMRAIEAKHKQTNDDIALAFQDLTVLMAKAKYMVAMSKVISEKIRERKGDISDDETVRFKSYLLGLGINDPVMREHFTSNTDYFRSLGQQICEILLDPIKEAGGMMSLADAYCRVNRARGLELLSPEDLLHACEQLAGSISLYCFHSGALVLQVGSYDERAIAVDTLERVTSAKCLTVQELANHLNISVLLAKERLLTTERRGEICRDESIEGLRFYPNLLLPEHARE